MEECPICREEKFLTDNLTNCIHRFCRECCIAIVETNEGSETSLTCPMCREPIDMGKANNFKRQCRPKCVIESFLGGMLVGMFIVPTIYFLYIHKND